MKKILFSLAVFTSAMSYGQDCSELFISEYVEGWSNNKALEIYNPTSSSIDLSQYMIIRYSNGSSTATTQNAVQLTGTIPAKGVYVAVLEKLDPNGTGQNAPVWDSLQAKADGFYCPDYNVSNAMYFNGNDAVVLAKGTINDIAGAVAVDIFGKIGEDPGTGWTADFPYVNAGAVVTKDHSLIRKSTIKQGVTDPLISYFNPLGEYDSIPPVIYIGTQLYGNWASLGTHNCDCNTAGVEEASIQQVTVFPNPNKGEFYVNGTLDGARIEVLNSLGQIIKTVKANGLTKISMDENNRGLFFVRIHGNDGTTIVRRVIIK